MELAKAYMDCVEQNPLNTSRSLPHARSVGTRALEGKRRSTLGAQFRSKSSPDLERFVTARSRAVSANELENIKYSLATLEENDGAGESGGKAEESSQGLWHNFGQAFDKVRWPH